MCDLGVSDSKSSHSYHNISNARPGGLAINIPKSQA